MFEFDFAVAIQIERAAKSKTAELWELAADSGEKLQPMMLRSRSRRCWLGRGGAVSLYDAESDRPDILRPLRNH